MVTSIKQAIKGLYLNRKKQQFQHFYDYFIKVSFVILIIDLNNKKFKLI